MMHLTKMSKEGRVLIPVELRKSLGLAADEPLSVYEKDGELRIVSRIQALRQMQQRMVKFKRPGHSVVDELIRERREEAAGE
jgi:bifunctional DNA-binding transcriptional regulator/antitoxin component of YhaV-PrlF toxin-antitoxin module